MGIFDNKEPVVLKEGSNARAQLAELEALRGMLPVSAEKQLEADIRAVRAGIAGEDRILYELRNSHMDMYVLQDVYLEHKGLTAQIDFLVLTRQRSFVIECKNLYGNIEVNSRGDFIRKLPGRRREGMYSPITQNRRHLELIRAMKRDDRSFMENLIFDRDFEDTYRSLVVLANQKTVLDDRNAPEDVRETIIRVDQLVATIAEINKQKGPGRDKMFESALRDNAEWFLSRCHEGEAVDYAARYREMAFEPFAGRDSAAQPDSCQTSARVANADQKEAYTAEPSVPLCPKCGAPMVLRTAKRGAHAGNKFYGCPNYPKCRGIVNI